jgi:hypothetical protein
MEFMEKARFAATIPFNEARRNELIQGQISRGVNLASSIRFAASLPFSETNRITWMHSRIDKGLEREILDLDKAEFLKAQAKDPAMQPFIFDMAAVAPVIEALGLATGSKVSYDLSEGNLLVVAGAMLLNPISGATPWRVAYLGGRMIRSDIPTMIKERRVGPLKPKLIPLAVSWVRGFGALALPIRLATAYPEMSKFLVADFSYSLNQKAKHFGPPGRFAADRLTNFSTWLLDKSIAEEVPAESQRSFKDLVTESVKPWFSKSRKSYVTSEDGYLIAGLIASTLESAISYVKNESKNQ